MTRSPVALVAAVVLLALLAVACGSGEPPLDLSGSDDGSLDGGAEGASGGVSGDAAGEALAGDEQAIRPVVEIPAGWPSEIEAVYGRYWLYWEAFAAAHGPPEADPGYEPLAALSTSTNWDSLEAQLRSFADDGLVLELPEQSITEHLLRLPEAAILSGAEGEEVILQDCWIDDFVQRTVDGTVVSEAREAKLMNAVMRVVDGEWRVDGVTLASSESDGVEQCAELIR